MVLPKIVGSPVPIATVVKLVTPCDIMAVLVLDEVAVALDDEIFVQRVELTQAYLKQILVCLDAGRDAVGAIHETHVVAACCHAIPGLSCVFEVSNILVSKLEFVINISKAAIIASAATLGAMDEAVGVGFMVGTVDDKVVLEESC